MTKAPAQTGLGSSLLRWARITALTVSLPLAVGLLAVIVLWRGSLPNLNEPSVMPGLSQRVDVYRDNYGVPHIFAASRLDAVRVLGYVHASDRFFQMEMNRRAGQGRLAEVAGRDALNFDRLLRGLDLYRLAEKSLDALSPEARKLLDAYCEGVNNWLSDRQRVLPLEFTILGIKPDAWRPADSLVWGRLMALRLSANLAGEMRRAALLSVQPHDVVDRLYPLYPQDAPVTTEPQFSRPGLPPLPLTPVPILSGLPPGMDNPPPPSPLARQRRGAISPDLGAAYARLADAWPFSTAGASNEWVVSGARSATGWPLLANDPHLELETPVLWYLARINTPDQNLAGATVPGLPVVLLGQNDNIAWGFTTTRSDVQDIFIETVDPRDNTKYLTPGGGEKFTTRTEIIKIKGAADYTMQVRGTRHGPVISDFDDDAAKLLTVQGYVLALSFTGLNEKDTTPESLLRINQARNWQEFQNALLLYKAPPQNLVYADRDGHIGFTAPGDVPVRKEYNGRHPVPGADGRYDWQGFVPFPYVPRLYDPDGGAIFNANNAVIGRNAYWFGREWDAPYRAERIHQLLRGQDKFGILDMQAMQMDVVAPPAKQLMPWLQRIKPENEQEKKALSLLAQWDFAMSEDRPEPLIFEWWLMRLYDALVRPPFGKMAAVLKQYDAQAAADILHNPAGWCDKLLTPKSSDCAPQITAAFRQTMQELTARYGQDFTGWRWGDEHFAPLENRVMRHLPLFNALFGLKGADSGGTYTINRGGNDDQAGQQHPLAKTHGAGYRAVYDLRNPDQSQFVIATGQSGHPLSPFYANFLPLWRKGQSIRIAGTKEELAANHRGHLVMLPGDAWQ